MIRASAVSCLNHCQCPCLILLRLLPEPHPQAHCYYTYFTKVLRTTRSGMILFYSPCSPCCSLTPSSDLGTLFSSTWICLQTSACSGLQLQPFRSAAMAAPRRGLLGPWPMGAPEAPHLLLLTYCPHTVRDFGQHLIYH